MNVIANHCYPMDYDTRDPYSQQIRDYRALFSKVVFIIVMLIMSVSIVHGQSGSWDASGSTGGASGFTDHGSGVIQLLNPTNTGCSASYVQENTTTYNPCSATPFSNCYQVFFDCPGNDNIGSDSKGDGMAFSFSSSACSYNINNGLACGGGLGYMGACPQMITIEFDTYSSQGNSGFDATYGGGTSGDHDEIAIHRDGNASDAGKIVSADAGNLEDGQIHTICITYNPATHIMSITKDGAAMLTYDFTGSPYELSTYLGCSLNQTWSAGKYGATSQATVSNGGAINPSFVTGCTPMPVSLLSFTGKMIYETVVLNWATAIEINNQKFIIERSSNMSDWEAIGEVAGAGNSSTVLNYNFTDYAPLGGTSYYRLRQVDVDGTFAFSNAIAVQNADEHYINISPNPFDDAFTINTNASGNVEVRIYDVLGRLLYQTNHKGNSGLIKIEPSLPPGTYLISIQTDTFVEQRKIIRK